MGAINEYQPVHMEVRTIYRPQDKRIDWEQRRYEIAKDAMAAILSNPQIVDEVTEEGEPVWGTPVAITRTAVTLANLLVDELREIPQRNDSAIDHTVSDYCQIARDTL